MKRERPAVLKQIAARLIGVTPAKVTAWTATGLLPTDEEGLVPIASVEQFACRAIGDEEIELTIVADRLAAGIRLARRKAEEDDNADFD